MSFRNHILNVLEGLLSNVVNTLLIAPLFFRVEVRPWVVQFFGLPTRLLVLLRAQLPGRRSGDLTTGKVAEMTGQAVSTSVGTITAVVTHDDWRIG